MKKRIVPFIISGLALAGLLATIALGLHWHFTGSKPKQPIEFSHALHLDKVGLDCNHCHTYADKSIHAGIPALSICMDCHKSVAADRPEIQKLTEYWNKKTPVPWVKVHVQPWHVFFTHKRHIRADIQCVRCHGEVRAMTAARRTRSLEMGWCVNCHRSKQAPDDCLTCHK